MTPLRGRRHWNDIAISNAGVVVFSSSLLDGLSSVYTRVSYAVEIVIAGVGLVVVVVGNLPVPTS